MAVCVAMCWNVILNYMTVYLLQVDTGWRYVRNNVGLDEVSPTNGLLQA